MRLPEDIIVQREALGVWSFYNVFTRDCLAGGIDVLVLLDDCCELTVDQLSAKYTGKTFDVWDLWVFSNYSGLFADPTRKKRPISTWPPAITLDLEALLALLRGRCILISDEKGYRQRFAPKRSVLDTRHFGNFHQQLGRELILARREDPSKWWLRQKFTDDFGATRPNPYHFVQEAYLRGYFKKRFVHGGDVLDVGCGTGFYARLMVECGATSILGIDPNPTFIEIANCNCPPSCRFVVCDTIGQPGGLKTLSSSSVDYVYVSDTLLFYFVPETPQQKGDPIALLEEIRRILRPEGVFISIEPHFQFWLAPWMGEIDHPFTIVSEHSQRTFAATPTSARFVQTFARNGFAVTWMDELRPDPAFEAVDPRAYEFAKEFPLWQLYEFQPWSGGCSGDRT